MNSPAFPPNAGWRDDETENRGITKREYFAAAALQGMLANGTYYRLAVEEAWKAADKMIGE